MTKTFLLRLLESLALCTTAAALAVTLTIFVKIIAMTDLQVVRPLGRIAVLAVHEAQGMMD